MKVDENFWNNVVITDDIKKRFMKKISRRRLGCWVWNASRFPNGYGQFQLHGRPVHAHRLSYLIFKGPVGHGLFVLHRCNNQPCVNPKHLKLGTSDDNMKYMIKCGRSLKGDKSPARLRPETRPRGSDHYKTSLSENDVKMIRKLLKNNTSLRDVAQMFSISVGAVSHIKSRRSWSHI